MAQGFYRGYVKQIGSKSAIDRFTRVAADDVVAYRRTGSTTPNPRTSAVTCVSANSVITDEGIGISPEHLPFVTFWGYSPRREHFRNTISCSTAYGREVQIGGKGIGLPYATEVFR